MDIIQWQLAIVALQLGVIVYLLRDIRRRLPPRL